MTVGADMTSKPVQISAVVSEGTKARLDRLTQATDPDEQERLKQELAVHTFGSGCLRSGGRTCHRQADFTPRNQAAGTQPTPFSARP